MTTTRPPTLERIRALRGRLYWPYLGVFLAFHLLLPLAFVPQLFSWTGLLLVPIGNFVFGSMGVNVGYHRLLTHRSFKCPTWLERTFVILGVCSLESGPGHWVAVHRKHHQHSDEEPDPHSPLVGFLWGHVGWLVVKSPATSGLFFHDKYARDVFADPFYAGLHRNLMWFWVWVAHASLFFPGGVLIGLSMGWSWPESAWFGGSLLVWGVLVRTVYVWHITWAVNSLSHLWGYRNYDTGEHSRNNWFVALLTNGEGWHNNHHAAPRAAAHGHRWWELDLTYLTLVLLRRLGLVWDIVEPKVAEARVIHRGPHRPRRSGGDPAQPTPTPSSDLKSGGDEP